MAAKSAFDGAFRALAVEAERVLGRPHRTDDGEWGHRIWVRERALVILQQAAHDPQFGVEVNLWVEPWDGGEVPPVPSLIDWLHARHRRRIERAG